MNPPGLKDWLLLLTSAAFALLCGALFFYKGKADKEMLAGAVICGLGTVVAAEVLRQKFKYRRQVRAPGLVLIRGGEKIRIDKTKSILMALGLGAAGAAGIYANAELIIYLISWFFLLLGVGLIPIILRDSSYIMFTPIGFEMGTNRYSYTLPWDQLEVVAGELQLNPVLMMRTRGGDWSRLIVHAGTWSEEAARDHLLKTLAAHQKWHGSAIRILPLRYGLAPALVEKALRLYLSVPEARKTLDRPSGIEDDRFE